MRDTLWLPLLIAVVSGVILLLFEYRTKWFARSLSHRSALQEESPLLGEAVTPVAQLDDPTGDWIQIAEEVKSLLIKSYSSEEMDFRPYLELYHITPKGSE